MIGLKNIFIPIVASVLTFSASVSFADTRNDFSQLVHNTDSSTRIFFGVAHFGNGLGIMGHSFITAAPAGIDPYFGFTVSYAADITLETLNANPAGVTSSLLGLNGRTGYQVSVMQAMEALERYRTNGQSVTLYELQLTVEQKRQLLLLLEADLNNQNLRAVSYNLLFANCMSRPIEHLNSILPAVQRVEVARSWTQVFTIPIQHLANPGPYIAGRIPFLFEQIFSRSTVAVKLDQVVLDLHTERARQWISEIRPLLSSIVTCSRWNSGLARSMELYLMSFAHSQTPNLDSILRLLSRSNCATKKELSAQLMTSIYNVTPMQLRDHRRVARRALGVVESW